MSIDAINQHVCPVSGSPAHTGDKNCPACAALGSLCNALIDTLNETASESHLSHGDRIMALLTVAFSGLIDKVKPGHEVDGSVEVVMAAAAMAERALLVLKEKRGDLASVLQGLVNGAASAEGSGRMFDVRRTGAASAKPKTAADVDAMIARMMAQPPANKQPA